MPEFPGTFKLPRLAAAPGSPTPGQMYWDTTAAEMRVWNGLTWLSPGQPELLGHTFALAGDLTPLTTLPSIFVPIAASQVAVLQAIRAKIRSGTSVVVQVQRNGVSVGSPITVTTTATTTSLGNVGLVANDELTLVLSGQTGTPIDLSATLILEQTQ